MVTNQLVCSTSRMTEAGCFPMQGVILNRKEDIVATWVIRTSVNRDMISDFLNKDSATLLEVRGNSIVIMQTINGGKYLSLVNSKSCEGYAATQQVFVNSEKANRLILVPTTISKEEEDDYLLAKFEEMLEAQYPIPIQDKNKEGILLSLLKRFKSKLRLFSSGDSIPYRAAYEMQIDMQSVGALIVENVGKQEFIDVHKREPRLSSLNMLIDKKTFNFKKWQIYLEKVKEGKINIFHQQEYRAFDTYDQYDQLRLLYWFEAFGENSEDLIEKIREKGLLPVNLRIKSAAVEKAKSKNFNVEVLKKAVRIVLDTALPSKLGLAIGAMLTHYSKLDLALLVKKPKELLGQLRKETFVGKPEAGLLALVAGQMWLDERTYLDYEREYLKYLEKGQTSCKRYKLFENVKLEGTKYAFNVRDMVDPRPWFYGLETACCQHLHNAGSSCVLFAADNPDCSGMFNVTKDGHTVAQSWFWFNQETGDFVFDNIEVLGNELRENVWRTYLLYVEELEKTSKLFGIKRVCVGLGYSKIDELDSFDRATNPTLISSLTAKTVYSDAGEQVVIAEFKEKGVKNVKK